MKSWCFQRAFALLLVAVGAAHGAYASSPKRVEFTNIPNHPRPQWDFWEWEPAPVVAILDGQGQVVRGSSAPVTLHCLGYSGPSCTLLGEITINAVDGIADFTGRGVRTQELGLTDIILMAASPGLAEGFSHLFRGNQATPVSLRFTHNLAAVKADGPLLRLSSSRVGHAPIEVELVDVWGNAVRSHPPLAMVVGCRGEGCGHFSGSLSQPLMDGVASFANLLVSGPRGAPLRLEFSVPATPLHAHSAKVYVP